MKKTKKRILMVGFLLSVFISLYSQSVIHLKSTGEDMTPIVRKAIEGVNEKKIRLEFEKGIYYFKPDYAFDKYCYITNHENGYKKIIFPFEGFESVEVVGNGAELVFHGQVLPFLFENCGNVSFSDVSIDWDIPFSFQGEVIAVNEEEGWRDIKPSVQGFSWKLNKGRLMFPNIDGFHFSSLGSSLPFNPQTKNVSHGAYDMSSRPERVEKLPNGNLRFYEKLKHYPSVGSILHSKGPMNENRYAPAVHVISSGDVNIDSVVVHHALGMGFLFERSNNATLTNCGVYVKDKSDRVVSIIADATHFCNCKGDILVENCRFESMLDDGTNVHGTYVEVDKVVDEYTVRYFLGHKQQLGFQFAGIGDEIWFIHQPDPSRQTTGIVTAMELINDRYAEIKFKDKIPETTKKGDILENKTWNPTFTMRGCTIQHHRARNIVIKTPKKILIENNQLSSMMSSILFRGETFYWYESGAVEDVIISNNDFYYVAYSGSEHAVMYVTPRLAKSFDKTICYDRNIHFINNRISTFDNRIVIADRVDGLFIKDNTIEKLHTYPQLYPEAPLFELINCQNVEVSGNKYKGEFSQAFRVDEKSKQSLIVRNNRGFKLDLKK
ncbi:MAG: right-handed parallel beta-helix repeat-containing protein [Bacteroidales bacterium]|nr:right-handed parallel beta-helix repeat-containing protein [Bacteroidales bacterium]